MIAEVINLSKKMNDREIIKDLSFSVETGHTFAILGPNGAGKTTTVRLLTGLLSPTNGTIKLFNEPLTQKNSASLRNRIGVQNDGNLYESLTLVENLNIWGKFYGLSTNDRKRRIKELLNVFELTDRSKSKLGTFSKGMKQKAALARAMLHKPELLILDEPTSGLDPVTSDNLTDHLREMVKNDGASIIICTHQLQGLEELADDIGIIQDGCFKTSGPVQDLLKEEWPYFEFDIKATPIEKTISTSKTFGKAEQIHNNDQPYVRVRLKQADDITLLIRQLILADIKVYSVAEVQHTIKELYFNKIGELQS
ncbi:ABC transporter ATP-binding protein [Bacillus atrophaeus]|uniref:ABC transporter ATP-binding protein n=1 Tax=Bacillus atrophaeus TaxID=1452 RepID=UPI00227EE636|nr:ABC transporter ATP-binding protein [Bacillus atrophaeus]MCY8491639.1 ABC transporter ATP-binding protein [Bacillus atrophaeus]MCY8815232.1 ABC transporter ATP-binding protein [Bacillus atrophaeus]